METGYLILTIVLSVFFGIPSLIWLASWLFSRQGYEAIRREETLYFISHKAIIYYAFRIKHARFRTLCKILYLLKPFEIEWKSRYGGKLRVDSVVGRDNFYDYLYSISDVNIQQTGDNVKIVWPRGKLIDKEKGINIVEVHVTGYIPQDEIKDKIKITSQQTSGKIKKRLIYEITNESDATIRDFEFDITKIAENPKNIDFIEAIPGETSEADISVRAEDSIDRYKREGEIRIRNVVWKLPKIEKRGELRLTLEC